MPDSDRRRVRWALAAAALFLVVPPTAAAQTDTVAYSKVTGDLLPDQSRVDVDATLTGRVAWRLDEGSLRPGQSLERPVQPSPADLTLTVHYVIKPACCPNQHREGTQTLTLQTPLACIYPKITDGGWTVTVTLCGRLRAMPQVESGPGSVTPTILDWTPQSGWNPQSVYVQSYSDAQPGQRLTVVMPTEYDFTIQVRVEGYVQTYDSSTYAFDRNPGAPMSRRSFPIESTPSSPPASSPAPASTPGSMIPPPAPPPAPPPPAGTGAPSNPLSAIGFLGVLCAFLAGLLVLRRIR